MQLLAPQQASHLIQAHPRLPHTGTARRSFSALATEWGKGGGGVGRGAAALHYG